MRAPGDPVPDPHEGPDPNVPLASAYQRARESDDAQLARHLKLMAREIHMRYRGHSGRQQSAILEEAAKRLLRE